MRQLLPTFLNTVDPIALYRADARESSTGRPWVLVNMVASVDGATALDGVSGGLGREGDSMVFRALRAVPDAILVAGGTARAENYGPPVARRDVVDQRVAAGQSPVPVLAVVTGSANVDPESRLFEDGHRPLIYTASTAQLANVEPLQTMADVVIAGDERVDLETVLADLARRGAKTVLVEGGPSFNGEMAAKGLVDEWCISVAPTIAGGASKRIVAGDAVTPPTDLELLRVLEHDGELFCRYARAANATHD